MRALIEDPHLDAAYRARTLALPLEKSIVERMPLMDPLSIAIARRHVRKSLGQALESGWLRILEQNQADVSDSPDPVSVGRRALKNLALTYLMVAGETSVHEIAKQQYLHATNMTDRMAALSALVHESSSHHAGELLTHFYERWQHDPLVIDKWFALQATAPHATVETIKALMAHPVFTLRNPNRARALVFQFCMANAMGFHADDGSGYVFWADLVLELDTINPEIAARFARVMDHWRRHVPAASARMRSALERVANQSGLSRNVSEIVSKSLSL
jgi:aminopeptidase N